jgi:small subunit ribosomal protein S16
MPVKIRLQRHGKKGKPFYWIVAADSRSKRDGKFLEKLGTYNPNTNPATIDLNIDGSVQWLENGAQPTDTARAILSYKGVMLKKHLAVGVKKGALTEEQAEEKFQAWLTEKEAKIADKTKAVAKAKQKERAEALKAEAKVNEERMAAAKEAEDAAIKAEADAKAAEKAAEEVVEEEAPQTIDEAQAAAADEGKKPEVEAEVETKAETKAEVEAETEAEEEKEEEPKKE